jgi:urease accessory protein
VNDDVIGSSRRMRAVTMLGASAGAAIGAVAVAAPAVAHTPTSAQNMADGLTHPLLGLDHLLAMVVVGALAALVGRRAWIVPVAFVSGMVSGMIAGRAGASASFVEAGVALTVVAAGAVLALGRLEGRAAWVAFGAAVAGMFHGLAHTQTISSGAPAVVTPISFLVGAVITTAALHALGSLAGVGLRNRLIARAGAGAAVAAAGVVIFAGL